MSENSRATRKEATRQDVASLLSALFVLAEDESSGSVPSDLGEKMSGFTRFRSKDLFLRYIYPPSTVNMISFAYMTILRCLICIPPWCLGNSAYQASLV